VLNFIQYRAQFPVENADDEARAPGCECTGHEPQETGHSILQGLPRACLENGLPY
jgi:hypothetical protein